MSYGRRAIGATGFKWKELAGNIPPNPEVAELRINGQIVAYGKVIDVTFVDGGFLVMLEPPKPPAEPRPPEPERGP